MQINVIDTSNRGRGTLQSFETCANYFLPRVGEFVVISGRKYIVSRIVHDLDDENIFISVEEDY